MPIHDNPCLKSPERAFTLQKYLLLHSQHDALQCQIASMSAAADQTQTMPPSPTSSGSFSGSEGGSPNGGGYATLAGTAQTVSTRPNFRTRRSSLPYSFTPGTGGDGSGILGEGEMCHGRSGSCTGTSEVMEEEKKLVQVNQQIKTTLTELLNCESVRNDRLYSAWVQSRLMDAEREIRGMRRHSVKGHRDEYREFEAQKWDTYTHGHTLHL